MVHTSSNANSANSANSASTTCLNTPEADEPAIRDYSPSLPPSLPRIGTHLINYVVLFLLFITFTNALPSNASPTAFSPSTTTTIGSASQHDAVLAAAPALAFWKRAEESPAMTCACKVEHSGYTATDIVEICMIPCLVILSGILAGLTLGYMSLDTTQLNVLIKTGTEKQKYYASRVLPIRKDGHLLLITLILANMIVNEALPVIADGVLGGGIQAVVVSTALIVIFSEIIPQSVCTRFGLAIGSAMVWPVQILIWVFYIIAWPVARLLTYILGAHSGIVYRRAELKELISMHADSGGHGGDLNPDTITIVGATLDLQTKVVKDAMTPMNKVFTLPITAKLDYETLGKVLKAGHSRIPVYEEIGSGEKKKQKVIGVLLTKQLILLDPEDAVPLKNIPMNALPTVSEDLPLLQILNTFQEGRSHMAIVCRRKPGFGPVTHTSSNPASAQMTDAEKENAADSDMEKGEATGEQSMLRQLFHRKSKKSGSRSPSPSSDEDEKEKDKKSTEMDEGKQPPLARWPSTGRNSLVHYNSDEDYPCGVITLEDVLEELIGEEIYDETDNFDGTRKPALEPFIPPEAVGRMGGGPPPAPSATIAKQQPARGATTPAGKSVVPGLKSLSTAAGKIGLGMGRSRSAPGRSRSAPGKGRNNVEGVASGSESTSATPEGVAKSASTSTENLTDVGVRTTEPETLAQINEQSGSDSENDPHTTVTETATQPLSAAPTPGVAGAQAPTGILQQPGPPTPGVGRVPPLLSDAVLLERGRRLLINQGADPATLPNLRLAAPRSQPPTRSSTPTPGGRLVVPPVAQSSTVKKGSFKSPSLLTPIPVRQQSMLADTTMTTGPSTQSQPAPTPPVAEGAQATDDNANATVTDKSESENK